MPIAKAASGIPLMSRKGAEPKTILIAAPNPAPEIIPIKLGSASGLRKRPCKVALAIPNGVSTEVAKATLGKWINMST